MGWEIKFFPDFERELGTLGQPVQDSFATALIHLQQSWSATWAAIRRYFKGVKVP
jgi:hypothetical protein